jgi:hypothetical protein
MVQVHFEKGCMMNKRHVRVEHGKAISDGKLVYRVSTVYETKAMLVAIHRYSHGITYRAVNCREVDTLPRRYAALESLAADLRLDGSRDAFWHNKDTLATWQDAMRVFAA